MIYDDGYDPNDDDDKDKSYDYNDGMLIVILLMADRLSPLPLTKMPIHKLIGDNVCHLIFRNRIYLSSFSSFSLLNGIDMLI